MTRRSKAKIAGSIVGAVVVVCLIAMVAYLVTGHYHPTDDTYAALESDSAVNVVQESGDTLFIGPNDDPDNTYGLIFYPGAKVDERAYAPLLHQLAAQGWLVIDVSMPFDLAIFDQNAGIDAIQRFPQVEHWYVAGHSLGGAMAANFASKNTGSVEGLVLLAAYSTADLSSTNLNVVSVYGTNDGVLNREHYDADKKNLPASAEELVIDGGNHGQVGSYGAQAGDGEASISADEQVAETVAFIQQAARS
ncbi:MAG: alpha/beta hydrolase [Eggerthellaceae bacterium]|jgi:dienelactone hydrolase